MLFLRLVGQALDRVMRSSEGGLPTRINVELFENDGGKLALLTVRQA